MVDIGSYITYLHTGFSEKVFSTVGMQFCSLQETAKSMRVQITYESPLVSYVIYEG
jgi:hypothetical protein